MASNTQLKFVPFGGLTVLYGLNGAGKTRSLNAIRDFWSGRHNTHIAALIELPPAGSGIYEHEEYSSPPDVDRALEWAVDWALAAKRKVEATPSAAEVEEVLWDYVFGLAYGEWEHFRDDPDVGPLDPTHSGALIEEWLQQRLMLVIPDGTAEAGLWISAPAAMTGPETPHFNAEAELNERLERNDNSEALAAPSYYTLASTDSGETIMVARLCEDEVWRQWPNLAARHRQLFPLDTTMTDLDASIHSATRNFLVSALDEHPSPGLRHPELEINGDDVLPSPQLRRLVHDPETLANRHYASALMDAPMLGLAVDVVGLNPGVMWRVHDRERPVFGGASPREVEGLHSAAPLGRVGNNRSDGGVEFAWPGNLIDKTHLD